jgi:hypothetical protein
MGKWLLTIFVKLVLPHYIAPFELDAPLPEPLRTALYCTGMGNTFHLGHERSMDTERSRDYEKRIGDGEATWVDPT